MKIRLTESYEVVTWREFEPDEESLKVINKMLENEIVEDNFPKVDEDFLEKLFTKRAWLNIELGKPEVHRKGYWKENYPQEFLSVVEETVKEYMWDFLDVDDEDWDCYDSTIEAELED